MNIEGVLLAGWYDGGRGEGGERELFFAAEEESNRKLGSNNKIRKCEFFS